MSTNSKLRKVVNGTNLVKRKTKAYKKKIKQLTTPPQHWTEGHAPGWDGAMFNVTNWP